MTISLNTNPYFDDFSEKRNFLRVLFKPGFAVQSRELTQLQTALNWQIASFANHIFENGSVVIPGNSFLDTNSEFINVVEHGGVLLSRLVRGAVLVGRTTAVRAVIRHIQSTGPTSARVYVNYTRAGTGAETIFFNGGEVLEVLNNTNITTQLITGSPAVTRGVGSLFVQESGVFYINGFFVYKEETILEVSSNTTPSAQVIFEIRTNIVDFNEDGTLLDPAHGTFNFSAPGADRLSIQLDLQAVPLDRTLTENNILILKVDGGAVRFHANTPRYSQLEKTLAKRTYDESGNFIVDGLELSVLEDLRTPLQEGRSETGNVDRLVYSISPGSAYILGFNVRAPQRTDLVVDKARTAPDHVEHIEGANVKPLFGDFIYVTALRGMPNFLGHTTVQFFDTSVSGGTQIGTAHAFDIEYVRDDVPSGVAIYRLLVRGATFTGTNTFRNIGRVVFAGGHYEALHLMTYTRESGTTFTNGETLNGPLATERAIVHRQYAEEGIAFVRRTNVATEVIPGVGSRVVGATSTTAGRVVSYVSNDSRGPSNLLFRVPSEFPRALRNRNNAVSIRYTTRRTGTITTNASGVGSLTVSGVTIEPLSASTFIATTATGVVNPALFSLNAPQTTITVTGGPASASINVYFNVVKTNLIERSKTPTLRTQSGLSVTGGAVQLDRADVFEVINITSSTLGNVTALFTLDTGQRDTFYQNARLIPTQALAFGTLTVEYRFFLHAASGDYFSVDSYAPLGGSDFYLRIPRHISETDGREHYLKNYLDFRKIVTDGAELPANNRPVVFDLQNFLPRTDVVVINKNDHVVVKRGVPSRQPVAREINADEIPIAQITLNAFTKTTRDLQIRDISIRRFTMQDIKKVEDRVDELEQFSMLNALERETFDETVVDAATGLNRVKNGILVDDFRRIGEIAAVEEEGFQIQYEFVEGSHVIRPQQTQLEIPLTVLSTAGASTTGASITLPYTVRVMSEQTLSSRLVNLNHFLFSSWQGQLVISPVQDSWVEAVRLPTILRERTETVEVTRIVWSVPHNPGLMFTAPDWNAPRVTLGDLMLMDRATVPAVPNVPIQPPPPPPPPRRRRRRRFLGIF